MEFDLPVEREIALVFLEAEGEFVETAEEEGALALNIRTVKDK